MFQPYNKVFYLNNNKGTRKDKKAFKITSARKFMSPLNVQPNERQYKQPFKSISRSDSIYYILLQTINLLFPPLESSFYMTSNFPQKQCPWYQK